MDQDQIRQLREQLLLVMSGRQSHLDFQAVVADFPQQFAGLKPHGVPHSAWQLVEHLRMAQHDILEFSQNPKHQSPTWPEGYWPAGEAPPNETAWKASVAAFQQDATAMDHLINNSALDLFAAIDGGEGQTLLREALVVAAHNSYHLGQLEFLKKMLLVTAK